MSELRTVAVVLAGGSGTRVGGPLPKQFISIAGRPIIEHTIAAFETSPLIDEIVVVIVPGYVEPVRALVDQAGFAKVTAIVEGGRTRGESTARALAALGPDECHVLLHDAARPLVSQTLIGSVVAALGSHAAVDTAIASADTIVEVDLTEDTAPRLVRALDRRVLRRVQTPQAFRLSVIRDAYGRAARHGDLVATDDCAVVLSHRPDVPIAVVEGEARNMKVTEPVDVIVAEHLLRSDAVQTTPGGGVGERQHHQ